jgi:hypothetical protein
MEGGLAREKRKGRSCKDGDDGHSNDCMFAAIEKYVY